jgi:flagellar hook-associated protein 3 FlgL
MRITSQMLSSNFLYDLNNNLNNMQTYQQQMASGSLISKPSDNPLGTSKVMKINSEMAENQQYSTNISDATNWINVTDSTLGEVNNVLQKVNELVVSAGNATYTTAQLQSVKDEINQNVSQLGQLMNTSYGGKYIFGGTCYSTPPTGTTVGTVTDTGTSVPPDISDGTIPGNGNTGLNYVNSTGTPIIEGTTTSQGTTTPPTTTDDTTDPQIPKINSPLVAEISQGVTIQYNVTASEVMNFTGANGQPTNIATVLNNITYDLDNSNTSNLTGADLTNIQAAITNVSNVTTKVGALENRMSSAETENQAENTSLTGVLSSTDDVDYAQASMDYSQAQSVYQASLQVSSDILQKSLIDYLT